jgi:tetratricopeptide (TPR) repeat protein/peroxiredoxin
MWTAAGLRVSMQESFQKHAPPPVRALYRKHAMGNSLFRRADNGGFQDKSASAGVEMGRWAWSSDAWDFDHDGFTDLYIANGMVSGPSHDDLNSFFWRQVVANSPTEAKPAHDYEQGWNALNELLRSDGTWSGYERNVFYANNRDGTFSDVSGAIGLDFTEDGRAFALADFDHDGRLEVFLKNRNGPQLRILKNVADLPPAISFRLQGSKSNRDAIGARITVETEAGRQTRMVQAGSGFLSQHSKEIFFGLGDAKGTIRATIRWPSGLVQQMHDLLPNHRVWIAEGNQTPRIEEFQPVALSNRIPAPQETEDLPEAVETWLLAPVSAPALSLPDLAGEARSLATFRGKPVLLNFWVSESAACRQDLDVLNRVHQRWAGLQVLTVNLDDPGNLGRLQQLARERHLSLTILRGSDDVAGVYNILYRYLFDRHRDLSLPTSFLIDEGGKIVKIYQGPVKAEKIAEDFQKIPRTTTARMTKGLPFPGVIDDPEFRRNYLSLGSVFFQRGYLDPAESSFQQAFREDPSSAEALYGLGSVYLKQKKTAEARASFERAIKLGATYPDTLPNAWNNLGLLATQEGHIAEAIPYFEEALRLNPDHQIALENLGNAYRQQQQWNLAQTTLEHALAVSPDDPEANYSLGMVFAQTGDSERAYHYLQKALELKPVYPEALNNLGILYLRTRRRDDAVASFEKCIQVAPDFDQSYLNLARVYALEGTPEKARSVLLELLKRHPENHQAQQMLAELPH